MCDYSLQCFAAVDVIWCWPALAATSLVSRGCQCTIRNTL